MIEKRLQPGAFAAALVLMAAANAPAQLPDPERSCPPDPWFCPDRGTVEADMDFNFNLDAVDVDGDGVAEQYIDADELQCALDCLDGDADQDHSPRPWGPPDVIDGGQLRLSSRLSYRLEHTVFLPARARGVVHVDGRGARVVAAQAAGAAIMRDVHGNHCDANLQRLDTSQWAIQDLVIQAGGGGAQPGQTTGISIAGAEQLRIERIRLEPLHGGTSAFDVGLVLSFCRNCVVESSSFSGALEADIVVGEPGLAGASPDWSGCSCGLPSQQYPLESLEPALCVKSGASDGTLVINTHHQGSNSQATAIRIGECDGCVVRGSVFEGVRVRHAVHRSGDGENVMLRDLRFAADGCSAQSSLILNEGRGRLVIDAADFAGARDCHSVSEAVYGVAGDADSPGQTTVIRSVGNFNGLRLDAGSGQSNFAFAGLGDPMPLLDATRSAWASVAPRHLSVEGSEYVLVPGAPSAEGDIYRRHVWMDDGKLKFCCGPNEKTMLLDLEAP